MKTSNDPRHQARRLAISIIYANEISSPADPIKITDEITETTKEGLQIETYDQNLLAAIIDGINTEKQSISEIILKNSIDWAPDKIYKIDLSILYAAIWELKYGNNAPMRVIIDEAVELAKEFGETESPKFVNGILAGVVKSL